MMRPASTKNKSQKSTVPTLIIKGVSKSQEVSSPASIISPKAQSDVAKEEIPSRQSTPNPASSSPVDNEQIEDITLTPVHLLRRAIQDRNPDFYYQALTFDAEQRALQEREIQLRHRAQIELDIKSRRFNSRYFGWTEVPWTVPLGSNTDLNSIWCSLRSSAAHEYLLEDPGVSDHFFNGLRQLLVGADLDVMRHQLGYAFDEQLAQIFSPYPEIWQPKIPAFLRKKPKSIKTKPANVKINEKSIAQRRLEEDLAKEEAQLLTELSTRFKANPVPISSLVPKYHSVISQRGTKTNELRQKATAERRAKIKTPMSKTVESALADIEREESRKRSAKITSATILDAANEGRRRRQKLEENEKKSGLTTEHTFKPSVSPSIPDYEKLQLKFQKKLDHQKSLRPPTIPLPFTNVEKNQKKAMERHIQLVEKILNEEKKDLGTTVKAIPFSESPAAESAPSILPHETKAWKLTLEHRKASEAAKEEALKKELEEKEAKQEKSKILAAKLRAKLQLADSKTEERHKENLNRLRHAQKQRELEHKQQLREMQERLDQRLSLFEQAQVSSAKAKANAEFNLILANAGLSIKDL